MDLNLLKTFLHVSELGSLSRAAERLDLSQPALSRQVKRLEEELKTRLLRRTGRGVVLTEAGEMLEQRARAIFEELERIGTEIEVASRTVSGRLCFGLPATVGITLTGWLVERYRAAYPKVAIKVVEEVSGSVQEGLLTGRIDVGILYQGATSANLKTRKLWTERLLMVGPPAAALPPEVRFADIAGYPLVLPGHGHGLRAILEQYAFRHGAKLNIAIEADSLRVQLELVQRGLGYTILPEEAFAAALQAGRVTSAAIVGPELHRGTVLAWPRDVPLSRPAVALREMIEEAARSRAQDTAWQG